MLTLGPISFAAPWLLLGLLSLPILWLLLRLMPPAPRRLPFPAIRLLFGLESPEKTPARAPWWLVLLRLAIAALVVVSAAEPLMNADRVLRGEGPVVLVVDDGWRAAGAWDDRRAALIDIVDRAERADRGVAIITGAPDLDGRSSSAVRLLSAPDARNVLRALAPKAWDVNRPAMISAVTQMAADRPDVETAVYWATGGATDPDVPAFVEALSALGATTVLAPPPSDGPYVLLPPPDTATALTVSVRRTHADDPIRLALVARADDGRPLARRDVSFEAGQKETKIDLSLPDELHNSLAAVSLTRPMASKANNGRAAVNFGASGVLLFDERWRRRSIGIATDSGSDQGLALLSEVYFLARAATPAGTISRAGVPELLKAGQSLILLPDETPLGDTDMSALGDWVAAGGVLMRFAGPRLARSGGDALTPVTLRLGGRQLSGAMQWTDPARIGEPSPDGPFAGLKIPKDVTVIRQVLAQPGQDLNAKTWLRLEDDTPLVTATKRGEGWIVLVHTTANSDWSSLALSGLFVDMLDRMSGLARGIGAAAFTEPLAPVESLDGFGRLGDPPPSAQPLQAGNGAIEIEPAHPPGFYGKDSIRIALSLGDSNPPLEPLDLSGAAGSGAIETVKGFNRTPERPISPWLLTTALLLLLLDGILTVFLRGLRPRAPFAERGGAAAVLALPLAAMTLAGSLGVAAPSPAAAQTVVSAGEAGADAFALNASSNTVLAYVITGESDVDETSAAGLRGLSWVLKQRTAVEAVELMGVNPREDDLAFFPILYWPVTDSQPAPDTVVREKLNRYMASGGTILFDTRNGHTRSSTARMDASLARITRGLDIPALQPVGPDHVLTRSFYLMQDFPGRWAGGTVWLEAGGGSERDGVSRILIGDADWAGAWAVGENGRPAYPVVPGGERQREMAFRFGVNLVMYMLTGNYKADQVHIPAILERLGQ